MDTDRMQSRLPPDTEEENYTVRIWRNTRTGVVVLEDWRKDGRHHRIGAPDFIRRDPDTQVVIEEQWDREGKGYREDGPAAIHRDPKTGRVKSSAWYIDGKYTPRRLLPKHLARIRPPPSKPAP